MHCNTQYGFGFHGANPAPADHLHVKSNGMLEALLWNDIFIAAQRELGVPQGTIKATALIETAVGHPTLHLIGYRVGECSLWASPPATGSS